MQRMTPKGPLPKVCEGCGEPFQAISSLHRFCKPDCNPRRASKPRPKAERYSRTCERCGALWHPRTRSVKTGLCLDCREGDRQHHVYSSKRGWRVAVRARAEDLCEECGKTEQEAGSYHHCHHLKPRSRGGKNTLANGILLCVECHNGAHGGQAVGGTPLPSADLSHKDIERIANRVVELLRESTVQIPLVRN